MSFTTVSSVTVAFTWAAKVWRLWWMASAVTEDNRFIQDNCFAASVWTLSCKLLCHSAWFPAYNAHPFSSPLPLTSSLRPTLFNWWRSGCIVEEKFPKESLWCMIYDRSFFYIWKNVMRKNKEKGEKSSLFITKQLFNPVAWFRVVN